MTKSTLGTISVRAFAGWSRIGAGMVAAAMLAMAPVSAQDVERFDPDDAFATSSEAAGPIDADLVNPGQAGAPPATAPVPAPAQGPIPLPARDGSAAGTSNDPGFDNEFADYAAPQPGDRVSGWADPVSGPNTAQAVNVGAATYGEDDLIGAAEGVFGKGAEGIARVIEDLLREQGEPNGYIVGREAGGAFIFGARYGSGTLHHKVEGEQKVYWTGPSVGFDAGANAANTFVLVYNLYDSEDLFRRYPAGEGQAYFVGGLHASYMRRGDVVLIPIRIGAGVRLGINAGYMRFSKKQRWVPF